MFKYLPDQNDDKIQELAVESAPEVFTFFTDALLGMNKDDHNACVAFKLLVPVTYGYISRNDALVKRMQGCVLVEEARTFSEPLQYFETVLKDLESMDIFNLCTSAAGGVRVRAHNTEDA